MKDINMNKRAFYVECGEIRVKVLAPNFVQAVREAIVWSVKNMPIRPILGHCFTVAEGGFYVDFIADPDIPKAIKMERAKKVVFVESINDALINYHHDQIMMLSTNGVLRMMKIIPSKPKPDFPAE